MGLRLDLHVLLKEIVVNVYFQPPTNVKLIYPCIVYKRSDALTEFADDLPYNITKRYQVTCINRDPDSDIPGKVALFPMCVFDRHFVSDDLNHDIYQLYF